MENPVILIVEDERIVAEEMKETLGNLGYSVCAITGTGESAVDIAGNKKPDIVLMDISLQGEMNGITASGLIRERYNIPVIYLTAYADYDLISKLKTTEPYGYILKPYDERQLHAAIEIALYKHEMDYRLREVQNGLIKANEKLNLLSNITRHDILNQLTGLLGYLELIDPELLDPDQRDFLEKSRLSALLIQRQIAFTREYQDIGVKAPVWQELRTLIARTTRSLPVGKITIAIEIDDVDIFADPLLQKVFYNLVDNALRYASGLSRLRFSTGVSDGALIIFCEDDGAGIPKSEKEKIFKRGFGKNTGLGLFLCREILSITNITIQETGEPGKGARFEMRVPPTGWKVQEKET